MLTKLKVTCRIAVKSDMEDILRIEQDVFEYPWSATEFTRVLRQKECIPIVAEHHGRIVGFALYIYEHSLIHLIDFAVDRDHWRQGVGTQLMNYLKRRTETNALSILDEVREYNLPMQLFLRSQGFTVIRQERDAFPETGESAYRFVWEVA